ncbi:MAG: AEC family transporter, partial [Rhodospirillaceae bacterium]
LTAILPVFGVILLGWGLKYTKLVPDVFWASADKVTYYITFPALLCVSLAGANLSGESWREMMAIQIGCVVLIVGLTIRFKHQLCTRFGLGNPSFAALIQGTNRPNTYMGLALGGALYGPQGLTLTTLCVGVVVPLVNVFAVIALSHWGEGKKTGLLAILKGIALNPIILACAAGSALNISGVGVPWVIGDFLEILGRAALPIGLLAVGAGLVPLSLRQTGVPLIANASLKLLVLPIFAVIGGLLAGLPEAALVITATYAALPCSASAYVMTRNMGGDGPLMASVITLQTIAAALTIPLVVLSVQALARL